MKSAEAILKDLWVGKYLHGTSFGRRMINPKKIKDLFISLDRSREDAIIVLKFEVLDPDEDQLLEIYGSEELDLRDEP